jgi:enamine deaminase RidA (YjgF/YER057c/UK114 family)
MPAIERHELYAGILHLSVTHGDTIYFAGIVADDLERDMFGQTSDVLSQLEAMLAEHGLDRTHVLTATIYITDMALKPEMNRAWTTFFGADALPARATIGVADLGPGVLLEVVPVAGR